MAISSNSLVELSYNILIPCLDICEVGEISGSVRYRRRTRIATLTFSVAGKSATATTECRLDREDFRSCKLTVNIKAYTTTFV